VRAAPDALIAELRHVDLAAAARSEENVERIDTHEHHERADDQQRRDAEPAATDRNAHSAARKLQASAALAAAIFNIRTFSVVLVVAHGGPIIEVRVTDQTAPPKLTCAP